MKMRNVWRLVDKVYEMGYQDATEQIKTKDKQEYPDLLVSSIDHKRHREVELISIEIREKTLDD